MEMNNTLFISKVKKKSQVTYYIAKYSVGLLLCIFFAFPFVYMVSQSLMTFAEINEGAKLFTLSFHIENYKIVTSYLHNIGNTLIIVLINGFFVPLTALICAYPLSRMDFTGKKIAFALIMATVMIPSSVLMVPGYILFTKFGFVDKLISQYIGAFWGGGALNIFLAIQFMRTLPKEMDNACKIDGANHFQIFFYMILPLCANIFLYISISIIMALWMDFQGPLIYLHSSENFTIGLAFYYDFSSSGTLGDKTNELMAMCCFITILPILLFLSFQKQMIGGVQMGGIK